MMTMNEVIERLLSRYDTEYLLELLDIPPRLLLERFDDFIDEKWDDILEELADEY